MKKAFLLYVLGLITVSCKITPPLDFNAHEKEIIGEALETTPMRVLLTTHLEDSLFLRKPCQNVVLHKNNEYLQRLIKRMHVTMIQNGGIGIAANQVGVGRNLF